METLKSLSTAEEQAFVKLIGTFDYDISSITDKQLRENFLEKNNLSHLIKSYKEHKQMLLIEDLTEILREECHQEMDILKLQIVTAASISYIPYVYQNYQPEEISGEIRKALEFSLEALDWEKASTNPGETESCILTIQQMINNLSVGYDEYHNQININFSRILYSPDENYTRLHETHILNRVFQMYCADHRNCLDVILEGQHILLLRSVLYKEILRMDLSGITAPVPDYIELMAQTIYVTVLRDCLNGNLIDKSLPGRLANNLEQVGIDTYELDIIAENTSDKYIEYYHAVRSGNKTLSDVPDTFMDERIINVALKISYDEFPLVPFAYQTKEICREAIVYNPMYLEFVNPSICDAALCSIAVRLNGMSLEFVPIQYRTESICEQAITENGMAIKFLLDGNIMTYDLALSAVTNNYNAIHLIPKTLKSKEMILTALWRNPLMYKELSVQSRQIIEIALYAINSLPELALYLPPHLAGNQNFLSLASLICNGWQDCVSQEFKTRIQSFV